MKFKNFIFYRKILVKLIPINLPIAIAVVFHLAPMIIQYTNCLYFVIANILVEVHLFLMNLYWSHEVEIHVSSEYFSCIPGISSLIVVFNILAPTLYHTSLLLISNLNLHIKLKFARVHYSLH